MAGEIGPSRADATSLGGGLMDSRTSMGAATMRHHDTMFGVLRSAGFPMREVATMSALMDSLSSGMPSNEAAISICWATSSLMQAAASMASSSVGGSFLTRSFLVLSSFFARGLVCDRMLTVPSLLVGSRSSSQLHSVQHRQPIRCHGGE